MLSFVHPYQMLSSTCHNPSQQQLDHQQAQRSEPWPSSPLTDRSALQCAPRGLLGLQPHQVWFPGDSGGSCAGFLSRGSRFPDISRGLLPTPWQVACPRRHSQGPGPVPGEAPHFFLLGSSTGVPSSKCLPTLRPLIVGLLLAQGPLGASSVGSAPEGPRQGYKVQGPSNSASEK